MKNKILAIILSFTVLLSATVCVFSANLLASAETVSYERDTTWYDESKTILEIKDIPDFLEFMYQLEAQGTTDNGAAIGYTGNLAAISWTDKMPFEGQTVLLTTDIVLNSGITFTATGPSSADAYCFVRDGNQIGFGGTFDGQGHTISGLYISATKGTGGSIFGVAGAATEYPTTNVTVKNLQIKNSYITSTARGLATIFASAAFNANVRIENVYSNAHLHSKTATSDAAPLMGGLCANVGGTLTIDNCVYAGTMTSEIDSSTTAKKYIGGLVGMTSNKKLNDVTYYGVLNVQASAFYGTLINDKASLMGKVIGYKTASDPNCPEATLTVENSILAGTMQTKTNTSIGTIAGEITSNTKVLISGTVYTPMKYNSTDVTSVIGAKTDTVTVSGEPTKVTDASLVGDKSASGLGNGLDTYWISGADAKGYPLPLGIVSTFSEESIKHDYVTALVDPKAELLEALGVKKNNDDKYTASSYLAYSTAYDEIVATINAEGADYDKIDVPSLKATAESKLVTVESVRAELLTALGAKLENNERYTESSYAEYSTAYDEIVAIINTAGADIEQIDLATLKFSAEAKLVDAPIEESVIINNQGSASINVVIDYLGNSTLNAVYSVDVIWDDISFTYDAGSLQWDPEKHEYAMLDGKEGWRDASGNITVINHSNAGVSVDIVFEQSAEKNGTASLTVATPSFGLGSAVGTTVADAPRASTAITVTGTPERGGSIGKLTVTISRAKS